MSSGLRNATSLSTPAAIVPNGPSPEVLPPDDSDDGCVHFWVIESPNGPTSQGVCKFCGKTQSFRNSISTSTWNKGSLKRADEWRELL